MHLVAWACLGTTPKVHNVFQPKFKDRSDPPSSIVKENEIKILCFAILNEVFPSVLLIMSYWKNLGKLTITDSVTSTTDADVSPYRCSVIKNKAKHRKLDYSLRTHVWYKTIWVLERTIVRFHYLLFLSMSSQYSVWPLSEVWTVGWFCLYHMLYSGDSDLSWTSFYMWQLPQKYHEIFCERSNRRRS